MLRLTVQLVPNGDESKASELVQVTISNSGVKLNDGQTIYNYQGTIKDWNETREIHGRVAHYRPSPLIILLYKIFSGEVKRLTQK